MDTLITNASTTFSNAFGFNYASVVEFMEDWLLTLIGSGLGVLQALMPYIIGLAVISAIVYFLFRAFRFFRH